MDQPFFITGYPRSMTAWLSVALDCAHDRDGKSLDEFMRELESGNQIGNSDSTISMSYDMIKQKHPDSRWVIIERDKNEALYSFCKVSGLDEVKCSVFFDHLEECLSRITTALRVKFSEIYLRIKEIWEWCRPEVEFPEKRIKRMEVLNIQHIPFLIQKAAGTV